MGSKMGCLHGIRSSIIKNIAKLGGDSFGEDQQCKRFAILNLKRLGCLKYARAAAISAPALV